MGEIADYTNELLEIDNDLYSDYKSGTMSVYDAYENGFIDELGREIYGNKTTICRNCGEKGLYWKKLDSKWRLYKNGSIHNCMVKPLNKS